MTARLVMTQDQVADDRSGWLKARLDGITGSEIAQVLGVAPAKYGSPYSLYNAKIEGVETEDNDAMMRGRWLEPYVDERFAVENPEIQVIPGGLYAHHDRPWQMATFDRLGYDTSHESRLFASSPATSLAELAEFPIQIKTAGSYEGWGDSSELATMPVHYRAQALWEMETWQADEVWVPVLFIIPWRVRTYRLTRDMPSVQRDIDLMLERAEQFRGRLERRDPPEIDWTPATTETLRKLHPAIVERDAPIPRGLQRRFMQARDARDAADRRYKLITNLIRSHMGDAHRAINRDTGELVATRVVSDAPVKAHTRHNDYLIAPRKGKASSE